jgi:hypothetical protein
MRAVTYELGRTLLLSDAVSPEALANALHVAVADRVSLVRALLSTGAIEPDALEEELARADAPLQRHVVPLTSLMDQLPDGLCQRLLAVPVRHDPMTGTVDVVVADARDLHAAEEIAFILQVPIRVLRAPLAAIEAALQTTAASVAPPASVIRPLSDVPSTVRSVPVTPVWTAPILSVDPPPPETDETEAQREPSLGEIPIPLSRRITPPEVPRLELVDQADSDDDDASSDPASDDGARDHEEAVNEAFDEDDEPVVELRRYKTPPPVGVASVRAADQLASIFREMKRIDDRDPLLELVLLALRTIARKAAIFVVKKEGYVGWMCTSEFADRADLHKLQIDARAPTFLSVASKGGSFVGIIERSEAHAPLLRIMKSLAPEVAAVTVRVSGRPAVIVVAYDFADPRTAMGHIEQVADAAGEALERILRIKRDSGNPASHVS